MPEYKPCEYSPDKQHSFSGEDDRCFFCDAKPWYVSIRADHPDGAPVDPAASYASMVAWSTAKIAADPLALMRRENPDLGDFDPQAAYIRLVEDRDLYANPD